MKKIITLLFVIFTSFTFADTLTFITMTGVGSFSDTAIRQVSKSIEQNTGKVVIVKNMPGANGLIALRHFMFYQNDENTLLIGNSAINYLLETNQIDTSPVIHIGLAKTELMVYTNSDIADLKTLLEIKELRAGSTSPMTDVSIKMFDKQHNTKTLLVNYKQFGQALLDLSEKRIDYLIAPKEVAAVESFKSTGRIKEVLSLGSDLAWNAIFSKNTNTNTMLLNQIRHSIENTEFKRLQKFDIKHHDLLLVNSEDLKIIKQFK